ncbi:porphobilinogen synthase [Phaeodactylibacter luteus]|uniref:Delta-aminolevulinic acid dehydratase n=1 Tax=Phaeodactylibacter luteus TaxID=1564516 RepID=A0A5C6RHJ7_9BACT|nr:porphobilinogen synthase [Phaeodactylibacter luteus]TXB61573.1 porphobilinogen synthase [Phaeodactylibacter luteus]
MLRRPRRNRRNQAIRHLSQETHLQPHHLVQPVFLTEGNGVREEIPSLPGTYRLSLDEALAEIGQCLQMGIESFILFPKIPAHRKDKRGTFSYSPDNFYLQAATIIKGEYPQACLISDVALDPYSIDGHDGIVHSGKVLNDETLHVLQKMGVAQAEAGFDILGPSDMMDGRVEALRVALDEAGFADTGIMSYTAKYASAFYGPFRDALDSAPVEGEDIPADKKTYQMNPANRREALIEGELDTMEGADFLMVKPALHYMDVIALMKQHFELPIAAYHVSGECAMLIAACRNGWLDYEKAMPETLLSLHRAGADVIITYFAKDYAAMYQKGRLS